MILIISDEDDASTHNVIDWLLHYKVPFFRINETSTINNGFILRHQSGRETTCDFVVVPCTNVIVKDTAVAR
jgi:hypothetical protein